MEHLTSELHRILLKRISKALHKAKYEPASVDPETVAAEVLRPFSAPPAGAVTVPALDHDAAMLLNFGTKVSVSGKLERRIVANLVAHLARRGFLPHSVHDGELTTRVYSAKEAMELIFDLDQVSLRFQRGTDRHRSSGKIHGVLLVVGNGVDILSDWNYTEGDADGFDAAMNAFDAEDYA